jgi:hypothetical protein
VYIYRETEADRERERERDASRVNASPSCEAERVVDRLSQKPEEERAALEATHGHIDGFSSQLLYKCDLEEVASVGD